LMDAFKVGWRGNIFMVARSITLVDH